MMVRRSNRSHRLDSSNPYRSHEPLRWCSTRSTLWLSALWLSALVVGLPLAAHADGSLQLRAARAASDCRSSVRRSSCGSDRAAKLAEKRKARREAAVARREAAAAKREAAAQARREASQSRREASQTRREASQSRREEAREAAASRREEARAAALARREASQAKREEAKQRREAAAAERRERLAARAEARRAQADDDVDSDDTESVAGSNGTGYGTLRVNSRPWAQVYVDGRMVGHTPQMALNVPAGEHQVRLVNPMFAMSKTLRLKVRGGERITRVEMLEE